MRTAAPKRPQTPSGDRDDAVPGRRDRVVRADAAEQRQPACETEHRCAAQQRGQPDVPEPVSVLLLGGDGRLEGAEALGVARPVVLDPVAEAREPLGAVDDDRVDDLRDRRLERLHRSFHVSERELEVGDLLRLQPAPDLPLGRHLVGAVAAAPDQVEERRRELERAGRAALREQARARARAATPSAAPARTRGRSSCRVLGPSATRRNRSRRARGGARSRAASRSSRRDCRARRRSCAGRARRRLHPRAPRPRSSAGRARRRPACPRST